MTKYVNIDLRQPARRTLRKNGGEGQFAIIVEEDAFKPNPKFPKGHFSGE